jgi:serine phosphatase RsbU (regulator of sigma subunit)
MRNRPIVSATGTMLLTAFLILSLAVAVEGAFETRYQMAIAFARQSQIQQGQIDLEELLRLQIDEENSLRGYALTRDPFYTKQYRSEVVEYDAKEGEIRRTLDEREVPGITGLLDDYQQLQRAWRNRVAAPVLANPHERLQELDKRNKLYEDYEMVTTAAIRRALIATEGELALRTQKELDRSAYMRALWVLAFGLFAIVLNAYSSRLNRELEEERGVTEVLQKAFRSESASLPNCDVGSAYLSATSQLAVGGDVFDVYRLSERRALILISDVSGKGVDAAVLTAFIRFMVRAIALRHTEPSEILVEFNQVLSKAVGDPYLFASMFVGLLDTETFKLTYASAGHDTAFLRRAGNVEQLSVTGPVLGVMEEPFTEKSVDLAPGETLVLATDGLTEVRNGDGEQLSEQGAMALIQHGSLQAQRLADELVEKVRALSGGHVRDDVAILVIRVVGPTPARAQAVSAAA